MSTWTLPGYQVEEMLGFGRNGEVWRARESATGEVVALKRLRAGTPPEALEALRRQAGLLAGLDTPYVVRLREVVGDVLVFDHAPGGSLAALLARRGSLAPGEIVTMGAPLASALAAAHARGLVHGHLSPAAVLFTADGMPLLADLGLAGLAGDLAGTDDPYVEPAVAAGAPPVPASDVWALGALCWHLLTGAPPGSGSAPLGVVAPHAPSALLEVVESALEPDPVRRPTAAALALALQRAQPAEPVRVTGGPPRPAEVSVERSRVAGGPVRPAEVSAGRSRVVGGPPHPTEVSAGRSRVTGRPAPRPAARGGRRWRPSLPALPVVAAVVVVLALLAGGLTWAFSGGPPLAQALPPAPPAPPAPPGPAAGPGLVAGSSAAPPDPARPGTGGPVSGPVAVAPAGPTAVPGPVQVPGGPPAGPPAAPGRVPVGPPVGPPAEPGPPSVGPPAGPPAEPGPPQWMQVLAELDGLREQAFASGDARLLDQVYLPGSTAGTADAAALAALTGAGRTATGVRHELRRVEQTSYNADRAGLRLVDVLTPHEVRDAQGVVQSREGRGEAAYDVQLVRHDGAWRIAALAPLPG